jgi:hypothetical protein
MGILIEKPVPRKEATRVLTGKYFKAPLPSLMQGVFLGMVSPGLFSIQLMNADGTNGAEKLIGISDMRLWTIFNSLEEMQNSNR